MLASWSSPSLALLATMQPTSKFGELFQYSNLMAAAAGYTAGHVLYPKMEIGVAYVRFAVRHRAHFELMYRPELYRPDDPQVRQGRAATAVLLYGTASPDAGQLAAGAAAWSLVHGLATLWLNGNLPEGLGNDPEEITRLVAPYLSLPEQRHPPLTPAKAPGQAASIGPL